MTGKRAPSFSKERMRNLKQYKSMTDDEFDDFWEERSSGVIRNNDFEKRIESKINEFKEDYDIDDMKVNDMMTLRALAQSYIQLEDLEQLAYNIRLDMNGLDRVLEFGKLNDTMASLRKDITNMQNDLGITRKLRRGDREASVANELSKLNKLAKEFYEQRMAYVFCPKCKMLLATIWLHYYDKNNKFQFECGRVVDENEKCGHKFQLTSDELWKMRGVNIEEVPEFFK